MSQEDNTIRIYLEAEEVEAQDCSFVALEEWEESEGRSNSTITICSADGE